MPREIKNKKYDYIISTYALHHIENNLKPLYLKNISNHLKLNGQIIIGDIAFDNREKYLECKNSLNGEWDEDEAENYFVWSDYKDFLQIEFKATYEQISQCAGIIILKSL